LRATVPRGARTAVEKRPPRPAVARPTVVPAPSSIVSTVPGARAVQPLTWTRPPRTATPVTTVTTVAGLHASGRDGVLGSGVLGSGVLGSSGVLGVSGPLGSTAALRVNDVAGVVVRLPAASTWTTVTS
jgi:hypothetical protein